MTRFDQKALDNLEFLCRISATKEENRDFLQSLQKILEYMSLLEEIDTQDVEACINPLQFLQKNIFREDEPDNELPTEEFLKNAPDVVAGMIRVPSVIKNLE